MYELNNGVFETWSPLFEFKEFELSKQLPLPNRTKRKRKVVTETVDANGIAKTVISTIDTHIYEQVLPNDDSVEEVSNDTLDLDALYDNYLDKGKLSVKFYIDVLNYLNDNQNITKLKTKKKFLVKAINNHNNHTNESGFKNYIVEQLVLTSRNPKNQIFSYSPISFGGYEDIKKEQVRTTTLSLNDGYSMGSQQYQNAIGKAVIGVAATGLKDYFALVTYFGKYYDSIKDISVTDNQYFEKDFVGIGSKFSRKVKIDGLNLTDAAINSLQETLKQSLTGYKYENESGKKTTLTEDEIDKITTIVMEDDPALKISALLSLATDNAKELLLAKINAGTDFASMHIYLLILGFNEKDVVNYMTSPVAMHVKNSMKGNIFIDKTDNSIDSKLKNVDVFPGLDQFKKIYADSKELTFLGQLLKVNQGTKASEYEIYNFNKRLGGGFIINERKLLDSVYSSAKSKKLNNVEFIEKVSDKIYKDKPYLKNNKLYVSKVLEKALQYGLFNYNFSPERFYENELYRIAATDFYNLLKGTFNILDVVQGVPHFYAMIKASYITEKKLKYNVNPYKIFNVIEKALVIGSNEDEFKSNEIDKEI